MTTPEAVEETRQLYTQHPRTSLRIAAQILGMGRTSVSTILHDELKLFPYKVQIQQPLTPANIEKRLQFVNEILVAIDDKTIDPNLIYFTDESYFHLIGYVNKQNYRFWGSENPHLSVAQALHPQKVSVWCAFTAHKIYGPYFLTKYVDEFVYRDEVLEKFFNNIARDRKIENFWFQQDGAIAHRTDDNMFYIASEFGHKIIGLDAPKKLGGGIDWPPCSPDLNTCDYFLWGYLKDKVYVTLPETIDELKDRITREIKAIPRDVRKRVCEGFVRRLRAVIITEGKHIENVLH